MTFLTDLAEAWRPWAWGATWQLALLVALIAGLLLGARRMPPRLRYALWLLVTIKVFLPPSLGLVWGIGTWGIEPVRHRAEAWVGSAAGEKARPEQGRGETGPGQVDRIDKMDKMDGMDSASALARRNEGAPVSRPTTSTPSMSSMSSIAPISPSAPADAGAPAPGGPGTLPTHLRNWEIRHIAHAPFAVWLLGVVGFAAFVLTRYARFSRRLRDAEEVTEGPLRIELERLAARLGKTDPPELLLSAAVSSPLLCGLFRPRIVLPANLPETLSADDLSNVLLHELIHWRRRDVAVGWLQLAGQALFWFHPLVWLANARARHERECACDEAALAIGRCAPKAYGESLLKVLLASEGRSAAALGFLGIFERGTRIQNRLEAIMNNSVRSRRANLIGWFGLAVFALVCLPMFPAAKATGQSPARAAVSAKPAPAMTVAWIAPDGQPFATGSSEGTVKYGADIPLSLTVGGDLYPRLMVSEIRFEKRGGSVTAVVPYGYDSGPKATWKVAVEILDKKDGSVVARSEGECENSGAIAGAPEAMAGEKIAPMELALGESGKIPAGARFRLRIEYFPQFPGEPKGAVATSFVGTDGPVEFGKEIPLSLAMGESPSPRASSIRFEKRGTTATGVVHYTCHSGPKAKWTMVLQVTGKDGTDIAREEKVCENSGLIRTVPFPISGDVEFALGESGKIPAVASFHLKILRSPEAPANPTVSAREDGTPAQPATAPPAANGTAEAQRAAIESTTVALKYDEDIPLQLSVGEPPVPNLKATSIRFEKRDSSAIAKLRYVRVSGPKAKWKIKIAIITFQAGAYVVTGAGDEKVFENSGNIRRVAYEETGQVEFSLGDASKIPSDARYLLTVECYPEASVKPAAVPAANLAPAQPASAAPAAQAAPEAKPVATGTAEGALRSGEDIPLELSVGEGPIPRFWTTSIRFDKGDALSTATLGFSSAGGPKAKWKIALEVIASSGAVIARDETQYRNTGHISYVGYTVSFLRTVKFSLGDASKIPADAKFRLTVDCFPEAPAKPIPAANAMIEKPAAVEKTIVELKYNEDIPLQLSVGEGPVPSFKATSIRFEKRNTDAVATLHYTYADGPKAKWKISLAIVMREFGAYNHLGAPAEKEFENSGAIVKIAELVPGQREFSLGDATKIPAGAKFFLTVECFPEAPAKPAAPSAASTSSVSPSPAVPPTASAPAAAILSYVHDTAEGKRSLGASGHAVEFARPDKGRFVEAVHIYASRYGLLEAPQEDFHVYLLNEKKEVLADLKYPYSMIERGDMKWIELRTPSIEVPERFFVALAFNPAQTKGIYLGLDEAAEGGHSFTGLPGEGYEKWGGKPNEKGDWMVRVDLAEAPSGDKSVQRLADWKAPVTTNPFAGCIEAKYDAGESDDKQSYGGRGPAIQVRPADFGLVSSVATGGSGGGGAAVGVPAPVANPRLIGFRLYAGRYGTDYDPAQTQLKVAILDSANQVRWQGAFPYALFAYKSKWVDLVLKEPPAVRDLAGGDGVLTIAFDPEAHQTKGIYFHYNKNPQASHSFAGTVARGFQPVADREWIVRAVFESVKPGEAPTARTANEVTPTQPAMQSAAQSATEAKRAWGPEQATGAPDTTRSGDIETAWASLEPDGGAEWLELDYAPSFRANQVRIAETFNPGAVTALVLKDDQGTTITVVQVTDTTAQAPAFLEVPFALTQRPVKSVRVVLDTRKVPGWNEIDAVELVGPEGRGWAAAARASSTFAERTATGAGREPVFQVQFGSGGPGNAVRPWNGTAADPSKRAWGPEQATGAPDTTAAGDIETAWASLEQDLGAEWLELDYAPALHANQVRIAETFNPGAVTALVLKDDQDTTIGVVQVSDTTTQAPAFLEVPFALTQRPVKSVRVVLDTRKVPGWNEIDAVELVGPEGRGWAVAARASSTYAERASRAAAAGPATALPAGTPPRIVSTNPAVGAVDVDPATAEITVTFDRDMAGGFSWTGGGEYYPKFPEGAKPSWRDKRTGILPVKLEAGHFYRVGINAPSFGNFRSAEGVSAPPSAIYFSTKGASDDVKALAQPPQIVKMEPANAATGVDPRKTTELRVTFNVPMGGGNSWCGGGPSFPTIPEGKRASWSEDHKTAILPVALQPDKTYRLSLNAPSFKNFTNAAGVALDPVPYSFTTGK